ncbi:MAG: molybdopterin converting factor subunit 1 [Acidocella sp. 20-61-6]|nr:MAG: molybdopterin converting factor subunit 1 [Acidocella sp. 20-61-6]
MKILYFAWLREKIGVAQEELAVPGEVRTVRELALWLGQQSPRHAAAFANAGLVRCAIDQEFAQGETLINGAAEVAFFPPVTGG